MLKSLKWSILCLFLFAGTTVILAQDPEEVEIKTESDDPNEDQFNKPLDEVTEKITMLERRVLPYQPVRESDVFWERRTWRIIDTREKMNLPFMYPEEPFFKILADAAAKGDITVYSGENDKFEKPMSAEELTSKLSSVDTVITFDPETYEEQVKIVKNDINFDDVKRYRLKEIWFFDKETSQLQVRILGISPIINKNDDEGNFLYELPLFWVYYPNIRELLARHRVFNQEGNTNATISWEDLFEMRYFASYIYKSSNVHDRKLGDYLTGVDMLMESDRIKNEIFNYEHDLWQY